MKSLIQAIFAEAAALKTRLQADEAFLSSVEAGAKALQSVHQSGGTIYSCGNGGSSCDAMHLTEELVARYKRERPGIKAMHFLDGPTITCWANDYSYDDVFRRHAEVFCSKNDVLIGISTSGNSENVLRAITMAKTKGCYTIGLLGRDGGKIKPICDLPIIVPSNATERIQEVHITIFHAWCEALETT